MRFSDHSLRSICFWFTVALTSAPWPGVCAAAQSLSSTKVAAKPDLGVSAPPAGASAVLVDLASRAAVIFSGQVLAITPFKGVVDIRFQVETPIRNCPQNGDYVLREWAGLWTAHRNRYRVGQHVLLFLTARGAAGLSAPVDVNDGIVPLVATAPQPIMDASGMVPADAASAGLMVDLRWLQARVARTSAAPVVLNALRARSSTGQAWSGPVPPLAPAPVTTLTSVIELLGQGGGDAQF